MKFRVMKVLLAVLVAVSTFGLNIQAKDFALPKIVITKDMAVAKSAKNQEIELALDGDKKTFWQSTPSVEKSYEGMYDHNRYIDIKLDGTYDITGINIFNNVDNSYNNYYVYTSVDGANFDKIISKTDSNIANAEGDVHSVNKRASYIRLNLAYNSKTFTTNLAEIEVYGTKAADVVVEAPEIQTTPWEGSSYQKEWDKFETESTYANEKVIIEASALVKRVIGANWVESFQFELRDTANGVDGLGNDVFEIENGKNNTIIIRGNDGVSLASGFNYYLKNYVAVDYNPLFASNTKVDKIVPIGNKIVKETQYDYRYALNFCTYSYTMSFWNWEEYEKFIDWAAMNGVNLMLDIVGQEEVLRQMLSEFNYSTAEIKDYLSGPAYFAWFYMQNLYSIGGPLPDAWFEQRVELGRKMHDRMQTYGIDPVIQGFAGQVPYTFADKNEGAVLTEKDSWPSFVRPSIIKTYLSDEEIAAGKKNYFATASEKFYSAQKNVFGDVSNYYAADPFHEGGQTGGLDMNRIYREVQTEMIQSNDEAVWIMQQWQGNLNNNKLSGLVRPEQGLALDLQSDLNQQNDPMESTGTPWIYNMLHNFGGRMGLDGEIEKMATNPATTFKDKKHMKGIGITPEALENSPVAYEMIFDMTWNKDPIDYNEWTEKYAERRAGGTNDELKEAWDILLDTAYATKSKYFQGAAESVVNSRPVDNFVAASTWGHSDITYDKMELEKALVILKDNFDEFKNSPAYIYDLADVSEQVLSNAAIEYHKLMVIAKNDGDAAEFDRVSKKFLELIDLSDQILNSTDEFMVGTWINDSREMLDGADDWTKDLFEFNARALVTTWGCQKSGQLKDYSNRKWAGLTKDFYKARWQIWVDNRNAELNKTPKDPAKAQAESNWFLWEWQWVNRKSDDGFGYSNKQTTANDLKTLATKVYDDFSVTNLGKFTDGPVEERINIAKGKVVTSTSTTGEGDLKNLTDDNTGSGWTAQGAGPHEMIVDLEGVYTLEEIGIYIKQAAGDYQFDYKIESHNPETNAWDVAADHANEVMPSSVNVNTSNIADQIKLTMKSRDVANYPVFVGEIKAFGKAKDIKTYYNIALNKKVTSEQTAANDGPLTNAVDGNLASLWKTNGWGPSSFPASITIDLEGEFNIEYLNVHFETAGRPFFVNVEVEDTLNARHRVLDLSDNKGGLDKSYKIPVNKNIKKVYVNFTGSNGVGTCTSACGASGPALTEVEALSLDPPTTDTSKDVVFGEGKIAGIKATGPGLPGSGDKLVDGITDLTNYEKLVLNKEVVFELPQYYYVNYVNLYFEKAGLGLKYRVYSEDVEGVRTLISDKSESKSLLENRVVKVDVKTAAKKIVLVHLGNNGEGASNLAEPRFYEFEAFLGAPTNILANTTIEPNVMSALVDDQSSTIYSFIDGGEKEAIIILEKPVDINMVNVVKKDGESEVVKYKVDYYDEVSTSWKTFIDMSRNKKTTLDNYAISPTSIFTNRLKFITQ